MQPGFPGSIACELHKLAGQAAETRISHANTDHLSGASSSQEDWLREGEKWSHTWYCKLAAALGSQIGLINPLWKHLLMPEIWGENLEPEIT